MPHVEDVDDWKTRPDESGCGGGETLLHLVAQDGKIISIYLISKMILGLQ
jgi:hypothetical protein